MISWCCWGAEALVHSRGVNEPSAGSFLRRGWHGDTCWYAGMCTQEQKGYVWSAKGALAEAKGLLTHFLTTGNALEKKGSVVLVQITMC